MQKPKFTFYIYEIICLSTCDFTKLCSLRNNSLTSGVITKTVKWASIIKHTQSIIYNQRKQAVGLVTRCLITVTLFFFFSVHKPDSMWAISSHSSVEMHPESISDKEIVDTAERPEQTYSKSKLLLI